MAEENPQDDELEIDSLLDQLKENNSFTREVAKKPEKFHLDKEQLEQFILNSSGKLIKDSLEMFDNIKDFVESAPDAESVTGLAELMRANTSAIDSLNKILLQDKKSNTQVGIKQMDIDAKKELAEGSRSNGPTLTREEVFKKILDDAKVIEIEESEGL